jgi:hypothetical protein
MEYRAYPNWICRGKQVGLTRFVGAMIPVVLAEALERVALIERLSISDALRIAVWDFVKKNKELVKDLPIYDLLKVE